MWADDPTAQLVLSVLRNLGAFVLEINGSNALVLQSLNSVEDAAQNWQDLEKKSITAARTLT